MNLQLLTVPLLPTHSTAPPSPPPVMPPISEITFPAAVLLVKIESRIVPS